MSLMDDAAENMQFAAEIESFLRDITIDRKGAIYTMLLIYTAHCAGLSKGELLGMVDRFFDSPEGQTKCWN